MLAAVVHDCRTLRSHTVLLLLTATVPAVCPDTGAGFEGTFFSGHSGYLPSSVLFAQSVGGPLPRLSPKCASRYMKAHLLSLENSCRALSRKVVPVLPLGHNLLSLSETTDSGKESNYGKTRADHKPC